MWSTWPNDKMEVLKVKVTLKNPAMVQDTKVPI